VIVFYTTPVDVTPLLMGGDWMAPFLGVIALSATGPGDQYLFHACPVEIDEVCREATMVPCCAVPIAEVAPL
jgi:hypothetical protein